MSLCYNCFSDLSDLTQGCLHCGFDLAQDAGKYPLALPLGAILNGCYIIGRTYTQQLNNQ